MPRDLQTRPARKTVHLTKFAGPMSMEALPIKVSHMLEHNQLIKLCCRHMENIQATLYRSMTAPEGKPDWIICECQKCGCKHHRVELEGCKFG